MPENRSSGGPAHRSRLVLLSAVFGFLGVAAGAFGAHVLEGTLDSAALATFDTAVRYQLVHAVALLALVSLPDRMSLAARRAGFLFALGIVVFAGSLYALVFTGITALGAITPVGGLAFLAGWAVLGWSAVQSGYSGR